MTIDAELENKVRLKGKTLHLTDEILNDLGWKKGEDLSFEVIPPVIRVFPRNMDRDFKERMVWLLNTCYSCKFYDFPHWRCAHPRNAGMLMGPEDYCHLYEKKQRPETQTRP